ncbi:hypothetical protein A3Q56_01829 [Intoshia linei]|uniref:Uncharacterized protein n=1 Tax=Intoshia linei TaxID=1819745 RepID=A0A177B7W9_9BILA|nr:hypothetical protein A3Q56_01829 [Intoshia linei]
MNKWSQLDAVLHFCSTSKLDYITEVRAFEKIISKIIEEMDDSDNKKMVFLIEQLKISF